MLARETEREREKYPNGNNSIQNPTKLPSHWKIRQPNCQSKIAQKPSSATIIFPTTTATTIKPKTLIKPNHNHSSLPPPPLIPQKNPSSTPAPSQERPSLPITPEFELILMKDTILCPWKTVKFDGLWQLQPRIALLLARIITQAAEGGEIDANL